MAGRRAPLWIVALLLAGAAAALWGSAGVGWGTGTTPGFGRGLALVALAGFAGAVAVGGWAKRVVGAVITLAGLLAGGVALGTAGTGPGRWIALLGAGLLVVAGIVVIRLAARLPTLGAQYQSAHARRASGDVDKDMWDGLSHGQDPTVNEPVENSGDDR